MNKNVFVLWYLSCVLTPIVKYWIRKHCCVSSVCYARSINHLVAPLFLMLTQNTIFRSLHCPTIRRSWVKKETYYLYNFAFLLPKTFLKKHLFSVKLIILFSYSDWSLSANILLDSDGKLMVLAEYFDLLVSECLLSLGLQLVVKLVGSFLSFSSMLLSLDRRSLMAVLVVGLTFLKLKICIALKVL